MPTAAKGDSRTTKWDNVECWHLSEVPPWSLAGLFAGGKQKTPHLTTEFDPERNIAAPIHDLLTDCGSATRAEEDKY